MSGVKVIGLTGGIGMGKSTAAATFRRARVPVFDADRVVHRLQSRCGRAVPAIAAAFEGTVIDGRVDRQSLRNHVLGNEEAIRRLEQIVHPFVREEQQRFLARARARGARLAVLDVPLLLEGGGDATVDVVIVVSAPPDVQRYRVQARGGLSMAQVDALIRRQMPDAEKRRHADVVIRTGLSRAHANGAVRRLVRGILAG